jgi:hypothetical protein
MGERGRVLAAAGVLSACVLAGSLLVAPTASARNSTGFHIYNLTGTPITLDRVHVQQGFDDGSGAPAPPRAGDVLKPGVDGDHNHIELDYHTVQSNLAELDYSSASSKKGETRVAQIFLQDSWCTLCPYKPLARCETTHEVRCQIDGRTVFLVDAPGTVHEVKDDDAQLQYEVLRDLCNKRNTDAKLVTCDFAITQKDFQAFGSPHVIGGVVSNCGPGESEHRVKQSEKEIASSSYGIKYGVETDFDFGFGKVKLSLDQDYSHEWGTESEFSVDATNKIPENWFGWVVAVNPVVRVWGDFTLTIGGSTWILRHVYYDFPDDKRPRGNNWRPDGRPMTPDEIKAECRHEIPGSKQSSRARMSYATIKQRGSGRTEALVGGGESTTLVARAGHDILRGASGDDRLFGGPGRDLIFGGPGSDTIVDSRGRTRVATGRRGRSGPDFVDVRDGKNHDTVICGSGRVTVKADRRDRVRHCGG